MFFRDDEDYFGQLKKAVVQSGLSPGELWLKCFPLAAHPKPLELDAFVNGAYLTSDLERDIVVLALNEHFMDLASSRRISHLHRPGADGIQP